MKTLYSVAFYSKKRDPDRYGLLSATICHDSGDEDVKAHALRLCKSIFPEEEGFYDHDVHCRRIGGWMYHDIVEESVDARDNG